MNDIGMGALPKHKKPVTAERVIVYIVLILYALWIITPFAVIINRLINFAQTTLPDTLQTILTWW